MTAEPAEPTLTLPAANAAIDDSAQRVVVIEVIGVTRGRRRESVHRTTNLSHEALDEATERLQLGNGGNVSG
jgi:hypothetical protein